MFSATIGLMLYVENVQAEKAFWQSIGFEMVSESEIMGFTSFEMKQHEDSTVLFTVYDKKFIRQVSPEVVENQPSILFETEEIEQLHERITAVTDKISLIQAEPFKNFSFASPSGNYYAVKGK